MASLRDRLQKTLGDAYTLERELGGGGMSKVFVAEEAALGRKVVVKVLSSELAAEISTERFRREIQVSARLQHPHIVPVLASGETDGLPYYTMPFVEGEALRARLARDGALSLAEAMPILRDVARALEYAHAHGVVHRDIKPDNILLAGSSATVADFGIAKAVSDARSEVKHATLTSIGTTLGTPAYIAPEQAAGDTNTDHRADIYSFGCMAYEMLTGETPFGDRPPQKLLVAHMAETPRPIGSLRLDLPQAVADVVMRCLEKDPAARPQTASELLKSLDAAVSSGGYDAKPVIARATRRSLGKALLWWAVAFVGVSVLTRAFVLTIGLPAWAFPGVVIVMLLGLPAILVTSFVHHRTRVARTMVGIVTTGGTNTQQSTMTRIAVKMSPWVTWKRTAKGGAWALGAFGVVVAGWMLMWAFGIGSVGNLIAAGKIASNQPIFIADFASPANDTTLGSVVTEALRSDIAQSKAITPVSVTSVRDMLRRAQRPLGSRVDFALARELATREGITAVLAGDVLAAGGGFVLSARLVETQTGDVLATFRATASGPDDVIKAIDQLSKSIREKLGESLRSVRAASPLYQVTTNSLEALRKFTQGATAIDRDADPARGLPLIEEAIAIDSAFGMAYRKVAIQLQNMGLQAAKQRAYFERAFALRDRMGDQERLLTESNYFGSRWHYDAARYIAANEALAAASNIGGANNLGLAYTGQREFAKAVESYTRAIAIDSTLLFPYGNRFIPLGALGKWDEIAKAIEEEERRLPPRAGRLAVRRAAVLEHEGRHDEALKMLDSALRAGIPQAADRRGAALGIGTRRMRIGQLRAASEYFRQYDEVSATMGDATRPFVSLADRAAMRTWYFNDKSGAVQLLDDGLAKNAIDGLAPEDRPYLALSEAYAIAGRPDRAKALVQAFDKILPNALRPAEVIARQRALGEIAIAERRFADAVVAFRASDIGSCLPCALPDIARALDMGGQADSAVATYERYLAAPQLSRSATDAWQLAPAHKRLAELYDAKGNRAKAIEHYKAFIELWKGADPELQPAVNQAKQRLAALEKSGGD